MGMVSKRSRDRLLIVGAAAVSAVAFYFAWKAFRSPAAASDDKNEDGEKELQDLENLMKTNEEKGGEAAGANSYSEEQDGFRVEEFEEFVAEAYEKPQAKVTVDPPSNLMEEEEFASKDSCKIEEDQHGESRSKFEASGSPFAAYLEGTQLCLTSPSDGNERLSMENELQEGNHSVNLISSGACIGHDVCDSGLREFIHGISNGISDDSNPLFGDFERFPSSNPGISSEQVSSNSCGTQRIISQDFVTELCSSRDVGYDELSRQKAVMFLGYGFQVCDLKNQPDGKNASEFNQTSIDDKGMSFEGPVIELSDLNGPVIELSDLNGPVIELSDLKDVGELAGHLSDDGQHHNHEVSDSEENSNVGISLEHEFDSSVNKGMESLGSQEGLDAESSSSSDKGWNENPSGNNSEPLIVERSEHADRETNTVYSEKALDGQFIPLLELGNMTNDEKMECPSLVSPVTEAMLVVK